MNEDIKFLKETLRLAKRGIGWTNPNPMVGAVLVKNGEIIGRGYHRRVGLPHAEIEAFKACKKDPKGATLYVNLEPCSHFGRTPPCVDAIIKSHLKQVVCCSLDPDPKVHGKGAAKLKKAGIEVDIGRLKDEARFLNEAFFVFHEKGRPFIAAKFASSLDGKIATKYHDSKWITNDKARMFAKNLRSQYQAVLVGINTVLADNPQLGGIGGKKDPMRIILDSSLQIPLNSKVLRDDNILIVTTTKASKQKMKYLQNKGIAIFTFAENKISLLKLLSYLKDKEIISVLVEGGGKVLGAFFDEGLVDKVYAFYAPIIIGGEKGVASVGGEGENLIKDSIHLKNLSFRHFEDNYLVTGYV